MDGAVFAKKSHTDTVNALVTGKTIVAGTGCKVVIENPGTPNARIKVSLDSKTGGVIDGRGGMDGDAGAGGAKGAGLVSLYELADWTAATDPQEDLVAVYDETETPQPKDGYFTIIAFYARQPKEITTSTDALSFVADGEAKTFDLDLAPTTDAWTAECFGVGFSIDITSGTGSATITVTAAAILCDFIRSGRVIVTSGTKTHEVTLTQAAQEVPDVISYGGSAGPGVWHFAAMGGEKVISVVANPDPPTGVDLATCQPQTIAYLEHVYTIQTVTYVSPTNITYEYNK